MATATEWAWLAGFFDGEGCANIPNCSDRATQRADIRLTNCDRDSLDKAAAVAGGGCVYSYVRFSPVQAKKYRRPWIWHCYSPPDIIRFAAGVERYTVVRRQQLLLAVIYTIDRADAVGRPLLHKSRGKYGVSESVRMKFVREALAALNQKGPRDSGRMGRVEKIYRLKLADVLAEAEERLRILSRPSRRTAVGVG